jgi:hypothetical protein
MAKLAQSTSKAAIVTSTQRSLNRVPEVRASERKLEAHITIGFAAKAPKFVVGGKHTVVYEK